MGQTHEKSPVLFNDPSVEKPAELIERCARDAAEQFANEKKGSKTQLRRFYQEYQSLRERIKNQEDYDKYAPAVKMMLSKAAYAWRGGNDAKIPESFYKWLTKNIEAIESEKDVQAFGNYFEAVLGYYYVCKKDGGGDRQ